MIEAPLLNALRAQTAGTASLDFLVEVQRRLEMEYFEQRDPAELEGVERADFFRWNALSIGAEVAEFLQEVGWKPWSTRQGEVPDRERALGELADVLHFIFNLVLASGSTGAELAEAYLAKVKVNIERQSGGEYDMFKTKCPSCGRDLGEVGILADSLTLEDGVEVGTESCGGCEHVFGTFVDRADPDTGELVREWTNGGPVHASD